MMSSMLSSLPNSHLKSLRRGAPPAEPFGSRACTSFSIVTACVCTHFATASGARLAD
jgi:hypothetical protein